MYTISKKFGTVSAASKVVKMEKENAWEGPNFCLVVYIHKHFCVSLVQLLGNWFPSHIFKSKNKPSCFLVFYYTSIQLLSLVRHSGSQGVLVSLPGVSGEQTLKMQKHIHTVGHFTLGSSSNRPVHRRMKPVGSSCSNISTFHWLDLRSRKQIIQFQFCFFFRFFFCLWWLRLEL